MGVGVAAFKKPLPDERGNGRESDATRARFTNVSVACFWPLLRSQDEAEGTGWGGR